MQLHKKRKINANPVSVDKLMGAAIKDMGIETIVVFEKIKNNWDVIVGITNAKNTKPTFLRDGKLTISVSSPAWMTQARFYKSTFIKKINNFDNLNDYEINEVSFKLDRS
ncbi:DciA family protein [Candidatus Latescibacterota bacterium]